jgi:hypothetical protein
MIGPVAAEGMNVEAHAGARHQARGEPLLGTREIGSRGDLLERRIAGDRGDSEPGRASDACLVGRDGPLQD